MSGMRRAGLAVGLVSAAALACTGVATSLGGRPGPEAGLLRGKSPTRSSGVTHVDRLTDGIASAPDDPAVTDLTSVLASAEAFAAYDLGKETSIACVAIVADADDRYTISLSHDGQSYAPLWSAPSLEDHGMEPRAAHGLAGTGRWLRLTASGGDGRYAVSELSVADACPPRWPPALAMQQGTPIERSLRLKLWAFAGLGAAFILGYRRRAPDFIKLLVAVPVGVGIAAAVQLADLWPPPADTAGLIAAAAGIVAGAVALRMAVGRLWRRYRGRPSGPEPRPR
jgi:hypothetical protein